MQERGTSYLPGAPIVARIRRLVITALVALFLYWTFTVASRGYCAGGVDASGNVTDQYGNPTDIVPQCYQMVLSPSPFVAIAIALIVILAMGRVLRRAGTVDAAVRILDRAAAIVVAVAVVSLVIAQVWFALIPMTDWGADGSFAVIYPFPFGSGSVTVTPMEVP